MTISYELFHDAFLRKISEYKFVPEKAKDDPELMAGLQKDIDAWMKTAVAKFNNHADIPIEGENDEERCYNFPLCDKDKEKMMSRRLNDIVDIIAEGMVLEWMTPYLYSSENFENLINTKDFTSYSPANLLTSLGERYQALKKNFRQRLIDYTYDYGSYDDIWA